MHILEMHISERMSAHNAGVDITIYAGRALFRGGGTGKGGGQVRLLPDLNTELKNIFFLNVFSA